MGDEAFAAVLYVFLGVGEVAVASTTERVERTVAEQAVEAVGVAILVAGIILAFPVAEKFIVLVAFVLLHIGPSGLCSPVSTVIRLCDLAVEDIPYGRLRQCGCRIRNTGRSADRVFFGTCLCGRISAVCGLTAGAENAYSGANRI